MNHVNPPLLIIVTGPPCSGKTTLAREIARALHLPLLAKDDLKIVLFEHLGVRDREWSRQVGKAITQLLYHLAAELLAAGVTPVLENNFWPKFARSELQALQERAPYRPFVITLDADDETLYNRWLARIERGERHPGLADDVTFAQFQAGISNCRGPLFESNSEQRLLDTGDFSQVDSGALIAEIEKSLRP